MSTPAGFDVAVVGGGLIGTALGYELTRAGARTVLIDRHDPGRATDAGAGILSPETMSIEDPAWFELATAAGEHYRTLVPTLEDGGARDTGYAATGALRIAFREWEDDLFRDNIALARSRYGVAVEELTPEQARERFPPLGEIRAAWYSRRAARGRRTFDDRGAARCRGGGRARPSWTARSTSSSPPRTASPG